MLLVDDDTEVEGDVAVVVVVPPVTRRRVTFYCKDYQMSPVNDSRLSVDVQRRSIWWIASRIQRRLQHGKQLCLSIRIRNHKTIKSNRMYVFTCNNFLCQGFRAKCLSSQRITYGNKTFDGKTYSNINGYIC